MATEIRLIVAVSAVVLAAWLEMWVARILCDISLNDELGLAMLVFGLSQLVIGVICAMVWTQEAVRCAREIESRRG